MALWPLVRSYMALEKSFLTNKGVNATYWKISGLEIDYLSGFTTVKLHGWIDETARRNEMLPLDEQVIIYAKDDNPILNPKTDYRDIIYDIIKSDKFIGAKNV